MTAKLNEEKVMSKINKIISRAQCQGIFLAELKIEYDIAEINDGIIKRRIDTQRHFRFLEYVEPEIS